MGRACAGPATSASWSSACSRRAPTLPPRNAEEGDDVPPWDDLDPADQALYARYMEVFAAMVDSVDQSVGRLYAALDELGEADNTIFVFLSDNGASREGEAFGTTAYFRTLVSKNVKDIEDPQFDRDRIDLAGGPQALVALPAGLGDGVEHAVPALQDQHPRRRPLGAVHAALAPAEAAPAPAGATSGRTSPTCCRRCAS